VRGITRRSFGVEAARVGVSPKWRAAAMILLVLVVAQLSAFGLLILRTSEVERRYEDAKLALQTLTDEYNRWRDAYQALRRAVNQRCCLENPSTFVTPGDSAVSQLVSRLTLGGWSDPRDSGEFWTETLTLYSWVTDNVEYVEDGIYPVLPEEPAWGVDYVEEVWQFPNETLRLRRGDCEDSSLLLCSMLINYHEGAYPTECIIISGSKGGHMAVQLSTNPGELTILDPAGGYYTKDAWGEPTSRELRAEIARWLSYWRATLGVDVRVIRVFSDSVDVEFESTDEYIEWMLGRAYSGA